MSFLVLLCILAVTMPSALTREKGVRAFQDSNLVQLKRRLAAADIDVLEDTANLNVRSGGGAHEFRMRHGKRRIRPFDNGLVQDRLPREHPDSWDYKCWEPVNGTSFPVLTIATVCGGMRDGYVKEMKHNRLLYAAKHGYRYCELYSKDNFRIPAFAKMPWMLALLPCSEYVIHVDADAMFYNMEKPLTPWLSYMDKHDVDLLLSQDIIPESPINFGVFLLRRQPWLWTHFKKVYNKCVCDWGRIFSWPAEQGLIYDTLARALDSHETRHSKIVSFEGWNHILDRGWKWPKPDDIIVHIVSCWHYDKDSKCIDRNTNKTVNSRECKYEGLEYYMKNFVHTTHNITEDQAPKFKEVGRCQQVRNHHLFDGHDSYSTRKDQWSSSIMDFDLDPGTGRVLGIKLGEVGCHDYKDNICEISGQWDWGKGTGPWKATNDKIHITSEQSP